MTPGPRFCGTLAGSIVNSTHGAVKEFVCIFLSGRMGHLAFARQIPDFDRSVLTGREEPLAVVGQGEARDSAGVSVQCQRFLAAFKAPYLDGIILARRNEPVAVRAPRQACN